VSFSAGLLHQVVDQALRGLRALRWIRARLLQVLLLVIVQTVPAHAQGGVILVLGDSLSSAYGLDVEAG